MASPQLEDGFTMIADEILDALARVQLSGHGWRILTVVFRKTYGWGKKDDWISNSQFVEMTGMKKQRVSEAMKELSDRNILIRSGVKVGFQKDYTQWQDNTKKNELRKAVTVTENRNLQDSSNGKPESCSGKPCTQYTPIQKTKNSVSPSGSPQVRINNNPKHQPMNVSDPRVKEIIEHFYSTCKEQRGFKPAISGKKDGAMVKSVLKSMDAESVKDCISFFLRGEKADKVGISISAALSAHSVNLWRQKQASCGVPAYKRAIA